MTKDVDLCSICGRPARGDGSTACATPGCPNADRATPQAQPTSRHERIGHAEPNRAQGRA